VTLHRERLVFPALAVVVGLSGLAAGAGCVDGVTPDCSDAAACNYDRAETSAEASPDSAREGDDGASVTDDASADATSATDGPRDASLDAGFRADASPDGAASSG
jgi:hypothetical protein